MASNKAPGLKKEQLQKAVKALLKHIGKQQEGSKDLLQDEEYLYLVSCSLQCGDPSTCYTLFHRLTCLLGRAEYHPQTGPTATQEPLSHQTVSVMLCCNVAMFSENTCAASRS